MWPERRRPGDYSLLGGEAASRLLRHNAVREDRMKRRDISLGEICEAGLRVEEGRPIPKADELSDEERERVIECFSQAIIAGDPAAIGVWYRLWQAKRTWGGTVSFSLRFPNRRQPRCVKTEDARSAALLLELYDGRWFRKPIPWDRLEVGLLFYFGDLFDPVIRSTAKTLAQRFRRDAASIKRDVRRFRNALQPEAARVLDSRKTDPSRRLPAR